MAYRRFILKQCEFASVVVAFRLCCCVDVFALKKRMKPFGTDHITHAELSLTFTLFLTQHFLAQAYALIFTFHAIF